MASKHKTKILVVDDDRSLLDILTFTFRREGYEVIPAETGENALRFWRIQHPDLIILDLNLPGIDGLSVCRQVRQKSFTPIIMLSVRSSEEDIINGLDSGADDYMTKPFSTVQLAARARGLLRRQAHATV